MTGRERQCRRDFVDTAIYKLLRELSPGGEFMLVWQQEHIAIVRDAVSEVLVDRLGLVEEEEFYPRLPENKFFN